MQHHFPPNAVQKGYLKSFAPGCSRKSTLLIVARNFIMCFLNRQRSYSCRYFTSSNRLPSGSVSLDIGVFIGDYLVHLSGYVAIDIGILILGQLSGSPVRAKCRLDNLVDGFFGVDGHCSSHGGCFQRSGSDELFLSSRSGLSYLESRGGWFIDLSYRARRRRSTTGRNRMSRCSSYGVLWWRCER